MFLASLVAVVLYSTMLRDVHGDPGQRSPRLRKLKSQRSRVGNDASNSVGNRSGDSPVVSNVDSLASSVNNKSSTGKKRWTRTVEMTDEQKAERRKALARSLLEQRARLAEEAKAAGRPPPSDDDWRKEGFAQKPSWWDRYQKVQRDQSAAVTAPNIAKGASQVDVMKAAAAAFKNWDGDDRFDRFATECVRFHGMNQITESHHCCCRECNCQALLTTHSPWVIFVEFCCRVLQTAGTMMKTKMMTTTITTVVVARKKPRAKMSLIP